MSQGKEIELPHGPMSIGANPVASPAALAYQRALEARRSSQPVAGGPTPPIPRLDLDPQELAKPSIVTGGMPAGVPAPMMGMTPGLHPNDMLPPEAMQDPAFQQGGGAMVAVNQPQLAYKYGVIRKGARVPPQMLRQDSPDKKDGILSKKTVEGLEELAKLQKKVDDAVSPEAQAARGAKEGVAAEAAKLGEEDPKKDQSKIIDDFDFDTFRQLITKDILNTPEQRKIIESRLQPLDLSDLIINGLITQVVPIRPGVFEPEFQSATGNDKIAIKRLIAAEAKKLDVPDNYLLDKHSIMSIAVGLRSLNKRLLPSHTDEAGHFSDELFWKKFEVVARLNEHMLASIGLNFFWFDERVRRLFVAENIKNG